MRLLPVFAEVAAACRVAMRGAEGRREELRGRPVDVGGGVQVGAQGWLGVFMRGEGADGTGTGTGTGLGTGAGRGQGWGRGWRWARGRRSLVLQVVCRDVPLRSADGQSEVGVRVVVCEDIRTAIGVVGATSAQNHTNSSRRVRPHGSMGCGRGPARSNPRKVSSK